MGVNKKIFKPYDICGIYPTELDPATTFVIDQAYAQLTGVKKILLLGIAAVVLLAVPHLSLAATYEQNITLPAGETVDDNFIRAGQTVTVEGTVNGDVIVVGDTITVDGTVSGDVIAAGSLVTINGTIAGNVRVIAETVELNGKIGKNVTTAGNRVTIGSGATVGWSLMAAGKTVTINGPVGGNVTIGGAEVVISSTVGNRVAAHLGDQGRLRVTSGASIGGALTYTGTRNASIESGAVITGETAHQQLPWDVTKAREFLSRAWIFGALLRLFSLLLIGTIAVTLFRGTSQKIADALWQNPPVKILWGLLVLIATPITAVLVAITIIGAPLALIIAGLYAVLVYLSPIGVGLLIGQKILASSSAKEKAPLIWVMMLGVFLYIVLTMLPVIGKFFTLVGAVWFLGAVADLLIAALRRHNEAPHART